MTTSNAAPYVRAPGITEQDERRLSRMALRFTAWAERWFPDTFVFAALSVAIVAAAALANGVPVAAIAGAFGDGYWSLITFTLQAVVIAVGGYVVATSPPAARLIGWFARIPSSGRAAIGMVAAVSMITSLFSWSVSLMFSGLLVRVLARRRDLAMDYRAAGAAAYLGMGSTWALGLSSAAAQLQANAASLPKPILAITEVIPFSQTIMLWQSIATAAILMVVSIAVATWSAPSAGSAVTAQALNIELGEAHDELPPRRQPGEWLEYSPLLSLLLVALAAGWLIREFTLKDPVLALSNLNTYNLIILTLALALHWRPRSFLRAVSNAVPATAGIIIQFPLYGAVASIMATAKGYGGTTVADQIARVFVSLTDAATFPVVMGVYSAVLGFFIPSGGGKWIVEAQYVMQAANELKVHLGWAVQVYNAAEALPNLINPFWMLPLLGCLGLKAREIVGFTFVQFLVHVPLVLFLLWAFAGTLTYAPPVMP